MDKAHVYMWTFDTDTKKGDTKIFYLFLKQDNKSSYEIQTNFQQNE